MEMYEINICSFHLIVQLIMSIADRDQTDGTSLLAKKKKGKETGFASAFHREHYILELTTSLSITSLLRIAF